MRPFLKFNEIVRRRPLIFVLVVVVASVELYTALMVTLLSDMMVDTFRKGNCKSVGHIIQNELPNRFGSAFFELVEAGKISAEEMRNFEAFANEHDAYAFALYDNKGKLISKSANSSTSEFSSDTDLLREAMGGNISGKFQEPDPGNRFYSARNIIYTGRMCIPVYDRAAENMLGVVEIDKDASELLRGMNKIKSTVWGSSFMASSVLAAVLAAVIWYFYRIQHKMEKDLRRRGEDLDREKEKLETIVDGVGVGLSMVDKNCRIMWVNKVIESWWGSREKLIGSSCHASFWKTPVKCSACPLNKGSKDRTEIRQLIASGKKRHFQVFFWPVKDSACSVEYTIELIQDITERVEMQMHLVQAGKMTAIGELSGSIAHEINNPAGITLATVTQMLAENGSENQEAKKSLEIIKKNVLRIADITSRLLRFSRYSTTDHSALNLNTVIEESLSFVSHRIRSSKVNLSRKFTRDRIEVKGNSNELQQVFLNLFNNALDAMPSGGDLCVSSEKSDSTARVTIADTGIGIAPENLERVFTPFFTTKEPGKGTGLGLSISKQIIEKHGGTLAVTSIFGKGTRFIITIPRKLN